MQQYKKFKYSIYGQNILQAKPAVFKNSNHRFTKNETTNAKFDKCGLNDEIGI